MSKTFFTSDTHFHHENVIKFCNRPYGSVEHMNEELIKNWNSVVGPQDHIWFLGDFSFGDVPKTVAVLERLSGIKHMITGNHDRKGRCQKLDWKQYFVSVEDYARLKVKVGGSEYKAVLCHFPFSSWERGYYQFHGHLHTMPQEKQGKFKQHDVGVDNNNYIPLLLQDAVARSIKGKSHTEEYYR